MRATEGVFTGKSGHVCYQVFAFGLQKSSRKAAYGIAAIAAALCTVGCQDTALTHPATVASQDEAAAVLVSVTNVAPWDQIASSMQPNFALTGDQALTQVLPATEQIQEQVLSAFGANLGIGLPQSSSQSTATQTAQQSTVKTLSATGPPATTGSSSAGSTSSTTSTTQPGVVPTTPGATSAGGQLPAAPSATSGIGLDPLLKYQAALDLFESVQMMNREVQNAAVQHCYVPFLVRLRIAVMPYRPNLGYALHTRVAFFPNADGTGSGSTPLTKAADSNRRDPCTDASYLPQIVPILAADDIERALKSRAAEAAQQIGLALSGMVHGIGGNLAVNNLHQTLNSISGQDFNSRLSVARQSDNTLYVRIGATDQATAGLALAAQNYDIALLLLAPRPYFDEKYVDAKTNATVTAKVDRQIRIVTYTQFRDAFDGSVLGDRPVSILISQADKVMQQILVGTSRAAILASWKALGEAGKETIVRELAGYIQAARFDQYSDRLKKPFTTHGSPDFSLQLLADTDSAKTMWVALSSLLADTAIKSAYFQLRWPSAITFATPQTALALDDTKSKTQVQLQTLTGTSSATLMATLNLVTKPPSSVKYSLPAQTLSLDPTIHLLTLIFPSPTQWGIGAIDTGNAGTNVSIYQATCSSETLCPELIPSPASFPVLVAKAPTGDGSPNFTLAQNVTQIVPSKVTGTTGSATVSISKLTDDSVTVTITGADIVAASDGAGTALALANGGVTITKDSEVTFSLTNLHSGAVVSVTAEGKKAGSSTGKKTVQFTVVS